MTLANYKVVVYRQLDGNWVAEVPAIGGCYALMDTREAALEELGRVFELIRRHEARAARTLHDGSSSTPNARRISSGSGSKKLSGTFIP